jgi:hypothetical protein
MEENTESFKIDIELCFIFNSEVESASDLILR